MINYEQHYLNPIYLALTPFSLRAKTALMRSISNPDRNSYKMSSDH